MVEVGLPYSDPIADGPVIAASYQRALDRGIRLGPIFETIKSLRMGEGGPAVEAPLVTMSSYSIILRRGLERFVDEAKASGIDGLIVPDLPVEEAGMLADLVSSRDLRLIQLITPRTPECLGDREVDHGVYLLRLRSGNYRGADRTASRCLRGRELAAYTDRSTNLHWLRHQPAGAYPGPGPDRGWPDRWQCPGSPPDRVRRRLARSVGRSDWRIHRGTGRCAAGLTRSVRDIGCRKVRSTVEIGERDRSVLPHRLVPDQDGGGVDETVPSRASSGRILSLNRVHERDERVSGVIAGRVDLEGRTTMCPGIIGEFQGLPGGDEGGVLVGSAQSDSP